MSDVVEPGALKANEVTSPSPEDEGQAVRRRAWPVRLLGGFGFAATTASFLTDVGLSDATVAVTGGLASLGVAAIGGAILSIYGRRKSISGEVHALKGVRQEIEDPSSHSDGGDEALKRLADTLDARITKTERCLARAAWRQGLIFTFFGAAVAVLLIVFGHWIPEVK